LAIGTIIRWFACLSMILGAIECFAGHKIMRLMIVVWGLFWGMFLGVVTGVKTDYALLGVLVFLLLTVGFVVLTRMKYKIALSVFIIFLSSVASYLMYKNIFFAILVGAVFGFLVWYYKKDVSIIVSAVSGAGIILVSAYLMMKVPFYDNPVITAILWVPIALVGIGCQYITLYISEREKKSKQKSRSGSSQKNKRGDRQRGLQKAYRNFCIKCGHTMNADSGICPECGFDFDN